MSTDRSCKTAKDSRGAKIHVGDRVTAISLHDGNSMNTGTVIEMWRQGYDGTILKLDVPPDPQYPHHWSHQASKTIKVTLPLADKTLHERLRARRVHGWIQHYRAPTDRNAIDPSWTSLLAEYGMRMGDTICGEDERRRVVARYRGEHVTCPVCRNLIAAMIARAFRVLVGLPTDGDWFWGCTPGPADTPPRSSPPEQSSP